jgi:hypothetical protein
MDKPLVFVSYCREDRQQKDELVAHLSILRHDNIDVWVDDRLTGGEEFDRTIRAQIERAKIGVLLISESFLNSDYICNTEMPALRQRRQAGALTLFPIIGRNCAWRSVPWLRSLNVRPTDGTPVWEGDEAATRDHLTAIVNEIGELVRRPAGETPESPLQRSVAMIGTPLTIEYDPHLQRQEFLRVLDDLAESIQAEGIERIFGRDALQRWRRHDERIRERLNAEFSLTVMGPFKRGKSTLVNALLREEIVTSDIAPETVTINEIRFGETFEVAACLADGGRVALTREHLRRHALEPVLAAVPGVTHLDVRAPVDWLRGICLVDTPGTGDLLERFDRQVQDYLARTDAVLFVVSPLEPLSESERMFLQLAVLPQDFGKITFVANMLDKVRGPDVAHAMDYLQTHIERLFPGAVLFGVSALDELASIRGEPRLVPGRSLSLSAEFDALRAHLQESILDNRELIQVDRAASELIRLLEGVQQHVERLRWAIAMDQAHLNDAIATREDADSPLRARMQEESQHLHSAVTAFGHETREWLALFLDRLEEEARRLSSFDAEDLQRHFPFFLADALRAAIHRCLEAHRPLILAAAGRSAVPPGQPGAAGTIQGAAGDLPGLIDAVIAASPLGASAAQAAAGDGVWERLDLSKLLFDLAQTQVFGVVTALMRQVDEAGRDRQKSLLYQQQFLVALPDLRRSVLGHVQDLYATIADRLVREVERQQQQELEASLDALRRGRHLAGRGRDGHDLEVLDRASSIAGEARQRVIALQQKWWPDTTEAVRDGGNSLALDSPASL